MHRIIGNLVVAGIVGWVAPALAGPGAVTLQMDNDGMFSSDDDNYTAGAELIWTRAVAADHWSQRIAEGFPDGWLSRVDALSYHLSYRMYTPVEVARRDLIENDRPYAGLALGGLALYGRQPLPGAWQSEEALQLDIGVVGPVTAADSVQREVHRFVESQRPRGWSHQLGNEPILNASYRRHWWHRQSLGQLEMQHGPGLSASLGNLLVQAGAGYGLRLGNGLDNVMGWPSLGIDQGGYRQVSTSPGGGWHVFAALQGRYVAHNLLLDGNTVRDSHSVGRRELVGDAVLGLALTWDKWEVSVAHVWRSREFEEQEGSTVHGALSLSYRL
ncbi:lipid A deacylase LpxR family protein [Billgrantia bachuensis]|uniref:Lipid A deacylase LpxR family protein n=1 Tax=Billgrantia bachuensis TaxID=2717286 RepID=A0ABX0PZ33_9GAMM|nr:lipid A deacylase LpxR family protein [Halomonas bachuensis]NIC07513.1 lipid A deacylase LpxR family protein [Halomonas bachuensis]